MNGEFESLSSYLGGADGLMSGWLGLGRVAVDSYATSIGFVASFSEGVSVVGRPLDHSLAWPLIAPSQLAICKALSFLREPVTIGSSMVCSISPLLFLPWPCLVAFSPPLVQPRQIVAQLDPKSSGCHYARLWPICG